MGSSGRQITSADIAAGAITQLKAGIPSSSAPTISGITPTLMPQMTVTLTTAAGSSLLVWFEASIANDTVGANTVVQLHVDTVEFVRRETVAKVANAWEACVLIFGYLAPPAGSHTIEVRWWVTGGTGKNALVARTLLALELKK